MSKRKNEIGKLWKLKLISKVLSMLCATNYPPSRNDCFKSSWLRRAWRFNRRNIVMGFAFAWKHLISICLKSFVINIVKWSLKKTYCIESKSQWIPWFIWKLVSDEVGRRCFKVARNKLFIELASWVVHFCELQVLGRAKAIEIFSWNGNAL